MTTPKTFRNWEAVRSGNGLVIHGENIQNAEADKITGIVKLVPSPDRTTPAALAVDKDGVEHRLLFIP